MNAPFGRTPERRTCVRVWDISAAREELGYEPQDGASQR